MFTVVLSAAMTTPSAPVPKDFRPIGPAPYAIRLTPDPDGVVRVQTTGSLLRELAADSARPDFGWRVPLDELTDLRITAPDGKAVTIREAVKLAAAGSPAVATADGRPVDGPRRRALKPGTLVLESPDLAKLSLLPLPDAEK